jgi:hypothetical protein
VDWVITGHEHLYQRMRPLRYDGVEAPSGAYGRGPDDGVGYLVLPPAGNWPEAEIMADDAARARLAHPTPTPGVDTVPSELGFAVAEIDGEDWALEVYGVGSVVAPAPLGVIDAIAGRRAP